MRIRFYNDATYGSVYKDVNLLTVSATTSTNPTTVTVSGVQYKYMSSALFTFPDWQTLNTGIDNGTIKPYMDLTTFQSTYLKTGKSILAETSGGTHTFKFKIDNTQISSYNALTSANARVFLFETTKNNEKYFLFCPLESGKFTVNRAYCVAISINFVDGSQAKQYGDKSKSTPDGGYGTFDDSTDNVTNSTKPTYSMPFGSGFHCYKINTSIYNSISEKLWGRDQNAFLSLWQKFKNYKFNPIAGVLSCVRIPDQFIPTGGTATKIQIAGTVLNVTAAPVTDGIVDHLVTFDSSWFAEYFASFMDYTDDTQVILHVPFCGTIEIPPYMCINGDISVNFRCDIITGNLCACVTAVDRFGNLCAIQTLTGNCGYPVPFSGNDNGMGDKLKALEGYISGQTTGLAQAASGQYDKAASSAISSTVSLWSGKALARYHTVTAGQHGGSVGICTNLNCFVEIRRAAASQPDYYNGLRGRPSDIGATVGSFSGFTVFSDFHADIADATDDERAEIERLMAEGVIL